MIDDHLCVVRPGGGFEGLGVEITKLCEGRYAYIPTARRVMACIHHVKLIAGWCKWQYDNRHSMQHPSVSLVKAIDLSVQILNNVEPLAIHQNINVKAALVDLMSSIEP
jgi:hypothetical protein